jgi:mRNA interferase YafQ
MARRGKDMAKLRTVLSRLLASAELPVEPDWLLIYRILGDELQLARTGSHANPFKM